MRGIFVISLDFELMWGVKDCATTDGYGSTNVSQVPQVINRLLKLFDKHQIHVTFGTVGLLMLNSTSEAINHIPSKTPSYINQNLSPYADDYLNNIKDSEKSLFFAPDIVEILKNNINVEIGSHTFGHYYCNAEGQTIDQFAADIERAVEVASNRDIKLQSIIFPRNNVQNEYLDVCKKFGITIYRGNAKKFFAQTNNAIHSILQRICRLIDTYINISGSTSFTYDEIKCSNGMINIPASRMLRPYSSRLAFLERLRLRRIKKELSHAASKGKLYHIWWHPHNFGANIDKNFEFLEKILNHFDKCRKEHDMCSFSMKEAADFLMK